MCPKFRCAGKLPFSVSGSSLEVTARLLVGAGLRNSTQKSYGSAQKKFLKFCSDFGLSPLPATDDTLLQYVSFLFSSGFKGTSIKVYLSAVRSLHVMHSLTLPPYSPRMLLALKGATRLTGPPDRKSPITYSILSEIIPLLCGRHDELMLQSAMSLSFFGCFRAGELCLPEGVSYSKKLHLSYSNVIINEPLSQLKVFLKQSKSDIFDTGVEVKVGCSGTPVCAYCSMKSYLGQHPCPAPDSPLFMDRNLHVLRKQYFVATTKLVLASAGYDPTLYSGHSFRAGSATAGASVGFSEWELKMLGRWSSDAYHIYLRDDGLVTSFARRLAESN